MSAIKVRGDFSRAWEVSHGRARRRAAEQRQAALAAASKRYPGGRVEGREPFRSACDRLAQLTGVTVRKWSARPGAQAFLGSPDRGIHAPRPTDAESAGIYAHECLHHGLDDRRHRDRATSWASEVETWRAVAAWWRRERLPDIETVERLAAECLSNRPEARRYGKGTLARALRAPVGSKIRETPQAKLMLMRGYG
jgi:hypothetical protein